MPIPLNSLSIRERILLVEDLWDSIAEDQAMLPFTPEQKNELDRRLDAYEAEERISKQPLKTFTARII